MTTTINNDLRRLRAQRVQQKHSGSASLTGWCGIMVRLVRAAHGGDIVAGRINGARHYWNRLADGTEVDLTSCQFGGDGVRPIKRGRRIGWDIGPMPPEHIVIASMVVAELEEDA